MTAAPQSSQSTAPAASPPGGINVDDVLFTLFRHKWLILAFFCLGAAGAVAVRVLRPPYYYSRANLLIPFVIDKPPAPGADGLVHIPENGGASVLNNEMELLYSHDVISNAVRTVGAERILARTKGGNDVDEATAVVAGGLEVEQPPRTSILRVFFKNRDSTLVQPVLRAVLDNYMRAHVTAHIGAESEYSQERAEELKKLLRENEENQRVLKTKNDVLILEDEKHSFHTQLDKIRTDLYQAELELAGRRAMLGDGGQPGATNLARTRIPPQVIEEYGNLLLDLAEWKRKDREAAQQGYKPLHPARFTIQGQIERLGQQKTNMLQRYEALAQYTVPTGGTNASSSGLAADLAEIKRLSGSVEYLRGELTNIQKKVVGLLDLDAKLHDLERQHAEYETNYNFLAKGMALEHANELSGAGNLMNITTFEKPTPPARDTKKLKKQVLTIFGGFFGCGLALAFLIDFGLDRSVKRRSDVERFLRLRVLQAIPDTGWSWHSELPWGRWLFKSRRRLEANGHGEDGHSYALTRWDPVHQLFQHAEGLRERLLTWFEVQSMNLKKPRMVGVTSCSAGAGVTTVASGLAASLSRIGNGNVLLVNMTENGEHAATQSFHQGQPGPGLEESTLTNGHGEQQVGENLFVAPANGSEPNNKLIQAEPGRLNYLFPDLKASDYDYIIFDMPRVSQTSSTARVAGYMDIVLLVLESEKTSQKAAIGANAMMKESRANVAAVLNKCRRCVPALLSQDL